MHARFPLGQINATPGALNALIAAHMTVLIVVLRHQSGDWGDLDGEDKQSNELALVNGDRIFSSYRIPGGEKIWVITESDRSCTTLLLPDEY